MMDVALQPAARTAANGARIRVIIAATIGTALEFFDLVVYGFFAVTISQVFFPAQNPWTSLLITTSTFGLSYLIRPLGAVVLGSYSDRHGRKAGLTLSISLMAVGTAIIAVAPSYASIGFAASILVVVARFIQGFSAGGEFGAATSFLVEHAPNNRRGFFASFQMAAQGLTAVLASLFGAATSSLLSPDALLTWGWRIPFVFGLLIIPVAVYIRHNVEETPIFRDREQIESPLVETVSRHKLNLALAILIYVLNTASSYVIVLFMPTFAVKQLGLDSTVAFAGTLLIGLTQVVACPLFGALSDRCGRLQTLAIAALSNGIIAISCFVWLARDPANLSFIAACLLLGVSVSAFQGPMPAALSEIFPGSIRSTGLALTHNLTVAMFGGFAPFIVTWGIVKTGSGIVPGVYIAAAATISLVAIVCYMSLQRKTSFETSGPDAS